MKLTVPLSAALLFLLSTAGGVVPREPKKVGCYFTSMVNDRNQPMRPEDIDASICSQLTYWNGEINHENGEIQVRETKPAWKVDGEGFLPRLVRLKAVNPDLKLILLINSEDLVPFMEPSRGVDLIKNGIKWLNESGFDGFQFFYSWDSFVREKVGDLLCEMKSEFKKHGYMLTAILFNRVFFEGTVGNEEPVSKLDRCSDDVTLMIDYTRSKQLAPLNEIKSNVDWYIERGISADKMKIGVPAFGIQVRLEDLNEKEEGANASEPVIRREDINNGRPIHYQQLQRQLKNSSLGWIIRRNENTKEVYAYSKTARLWMCYEDMESVSFKARYVLEKGLAGMDILAIEMDDDEGVAGDGIFPLTRSIYNTFIRHNETTNTTPQ